MNKNESVATTVRLDNEDLKYLDNFAETLNASGIGDGKFCRNDILKMILRHHRKKVYENPISNEVFEVIINNKDDGMSIFDAYTARAIEKKMSNKDIDKDKFEKLTGCIG